MLSFRFFGVLVALLSASVGVYGMEPTTKEAEFKARMEMLNPKNPQKDRLEALKWIIERSKESQAKAALPGLELYGKNEKDDEVRAMVVLAIGRIGLDQRPKMDCPIILLEALEDKSVFVRQNASALAGQFKRFPPKTVEYLLRLEKQDNSDTRSDAHQLLALAGGKDERVLKVLRTATMDKDFWVAHNAHIFLFQVTNDLEDIIPYLVRYHANWFQNYATAKNTSEEEQNEESRKDIVGLGIIVKLYELGGKRSAEMAAAYVKLLKSNEVSDRRAMALYIGQFFASESSSDKLWKEQTKLDPKAASQLFSSKIEFPEKLANRLRELKIGELLQKMSKEDPDEVVQKNATIALEKFDKASGDRKKN